MIIVDMLRAEPEDIALAINILISKGHSYKRIAKFCENVLDKKLYYIGYKKGYFYINKKVTIKGDINGMPYVGTAYHSYYHTHFE